MTAGIATTVLSFVSSSLPQRTSAEEENLESTHNAQQANHDSEAQYLNEVGMHSSDKHRDASQRQPDIQEEKSNIEKHRAGVCSHPDEHTHREPPPSEHNIQREKSQGEYQPQPTQASDGTSSAAASSATTSSTTTSSLKNERPAQTTTHQKPPQQRDNYLGHDNTGKGQVIYINGKAKRIFPRPGGAMYSRDDLRWIEYYETKIENHYVKGAYFDNLERKHIQLKGEHDHLKGEHEQFKGEHGQLKCMYEKDQKLLSNLQESVLSRVDRYQPKSDSEIEKEFREIGRSVVEFSGDLVSDAPLDVLYKSLRGQGLSNDMDSKVWDTMKKWNSRLLVESVIWKELYESLFQNPFRPFGLSDIYMTSWIGLFANEPHDSNLYPAPSEASERWRVITANALNELSKRVTQPSTDVLLGAGGSLITKLAPIGFQIERHWNELGSIISAAQELAKTLSTQKARLQLFLPGVGEHFSKKVYGHKLYPANKYGEDMESGEILYVVAPGLRKWGDGDGRCLEVVDDIIASKVLIAEAVNN